jgi:uncharacterized protein YdaU (DUF1376 family)
MSKDPAVLFYTSDFISGTITMTDEQRGKYILLLCLQHQKEYLTEKDMLNICKTYDEDIWCKFKQEDGRFYNERMRYEADKRRKYSESRRENRVNKDKKKICKTYDKHMENENEDINVFIDKKEIDYEYIKDHYNKHRNLMPKIIELTNTRKQAINARVKDYGFEMVCNVIKMAGEREFMSGNNDRGWVANFDWIMKPTNFIKILEGNYQNKSSPKPPQPYVDEATGRVVYPEGFKVSQ